MRVAFRADASHWIGSGHVVRCATLGRRLRKLGAEVHFVCRGMPGDRGDWLNRSGFIVHKLSAAVAPYGETSSTPTAHTTWLGVDAEEERDESLSVLSRQEPFDWLIVDHYALDEEWETAMRAATRKVMVVDDLADRNHACDILLDQNLFPDPARRYQEKVPSGCRLLLGPDYALLQDEYAVLRPQVSVREGPIRRVLVSLGGTERRELTMRVLRALFSLQRHDIAIDVAIGTAARGGDEIRALARGVEHVTIHEELPSLAHLMARADLAVGAGGITTWERCCMGLPSLVITVADNQLAIAPYLHKKGLIHWLGHEDRITDQDLQRDLGGALAANLDGAWSRSCLSLVDGLGTFRVAASLAATSGMPLVLRPVRIDDEALLLRWANDPHVRGNGFSTEPISSESHHRWFGTRIGSDGCKIYVFEDENQVPVGQVRLERTDDGWQIGYSIDGAFRGYGLAKRMLKTACEHLRAECPGSAVYGKVLSRNEASIRVFVALGFERCNLKNGVVRFERSA